MSKDGQRSDGEAARSDRQLGALLVCFARHKAAAKARRALEGELRSSGETVFDTTVLKVNDEHKATVHDPHRVIAGILTPMLTWGVFGLVSGGVPSLVISAVLGGLFGGFGTYYLIHHTTKTQLTRLGKQLPAQSSALLTFAETRDPRLLFEAAGKHAPTTASAAVIADDLTTRILTGPEQAIVHRQDGSATPPVALGKIARLSMVLLRYSDPDAAAHVASKVPAAGKTGDALEIELLTKTDASGHRHVTDPKFGAAAIGKNNVLSWGGLGLVCGAIAGATGSNGILGLLGGGLLTGVAWGLFGLGAGALYGLWAGRAISARRLKGIGNLLAPGTSTILAWADTPPNQSTIDILSSPAPQALVLSFHATDGGAILDTV
jgi:hypothetical protein